MTSGDPDHVDPSSDLGPATADHDGDPGAGDVEPGERLAMLRRLAAATAFAVPIVTSFSMDGLAVAPNTAAAGTVPTVSPWRLYTGLGTTMPFRKVTGAGAYMWMPSGSYVAQDTGAPTAPMWASTIAAGATGLRFEFDVIPGGGVPQALYWSLHVAALANDNGSVAAGHFSRTFTWLPATTTDVGVSVFFSNFPGGAPLGIDNVSVEGLY